MRSIFDIDKAVDYTKGLHIEVVGYFLSSHVCLERLLLRMSLAASVAVVATLLALLLLLQLLLLFNDM